MGKKERKITALVTAVGGRSVGYQIFECLKAYKDEYRIITTDADPFSPGLFESDRGYLVPNADSADYIPRLLEISKKENVDVVLPGSLPEIMVVAKKRETYN